MAAGDLTIAGTATAGTKVSTPKLEGITNSDVVTNLNADKVDGADKDTDVSMAANSDAKIPSQKAVKNYIDTKDAQNVKKTGAQTIAGAKTFSDGIISNVTGNLTGQADSAQYLDDQGGGADIKSKVLSDFVNYEGLFWRQAHGLTATKIKAVGLGSNLKSSPQGLSYCGHDNTYVYANGNSTYHDTIYAIVFYVN